MLSNIHLNPKGRDWGQLVNFDDLGKLYTGLIVVWSAWLFTGIGWLIWNRNLPFVRIRRLPVAIASTLFLHVYLLKIVMAYTTNGHFLCSAEFWIMSIYLPFGIALFQANCTQLRSIAERQERLFARHSSSDSRDAPVRPGVVGRLWTQWKDLTQAQKSYVVIAIGMLVQLIVTAVIYASSPELQGDWSSYGKIPYNKGQAKCRRSVAWVPSAFWQLFWTWIYGPYELYKIRHVRDTHRWRLQTVVCILAGLPGTPLWLAAVFSNIAFKSVNRWFVPPMWLAPGIVVMQFCTVAFPIYETFEYNKAKRKVFHSMGSASTLTASTIDYTDDKHTHPEDSAERLFEALHSQYAGRTLYSTAALDYALTHHPTPLLHFAATKDFSGENIVFLTSVIRWRAAWQMAPRDPTTGLRTSSALRHLLKMAVQIFIESIHEKTAEFPVNIEGFIRKDLVRVFEPLIPEKQRASGESGRLRRANAAFEMRTEQNGIDLSQMTSHSRSLWDDRKGARTLTTGSCEDLELIQSPSPCTNSVSRFSSTASTPHSQNDENPFIFPSTEDSAITEVNQQRGEVPPGFDAHVFDAAEASIRYLVLTNTWRKLVDGHEKEKADEAGNARSTV